MRFSVFDFIAIETLNEMIKERELAYKPDIRVYENDISLYWNEAGREIRRKTILLDNIIQTKTMFCTVSI